ncbi:hypothetical protein AGMMS50239_02250 [Bacteroidia bacterium]|nr:hypothetical protein FACS1894207_3560 [Bacteroidia bacterium]GHT58190.1 hypothetical protein AGMMS50239_02250 [Bacteroidia bacterium]
MNNSIFENRLSQYSLTTKEEKDNAMHKMKPLTRFCVKDGKLSSINMKILTDYQRFLPVKAFMSIERTNNTIYDLPVRAFISIEKTYNTTTNPHRGFTI